MTHGAVAAGDEQTAAAGARVLREGGNAFDAAVAAALAAFVCEVPLASPLGGGVLVARVPGAAPFALEFFARTPGLGAAGRVAADFHVVTVDFGVTTQGFHVGRGSAAVGLALPGLLAVHARHGRLPLPVVAEPAVELGRSGYVLGEAVAYVFSLLTPIVGLTPGVRAIFHHDGRPAPAGSVLVNADLASTLAAIARDPRSVRQLYRQLAREFGAAQGGLVTDADVDRLDPVVHEALRVRLRDREAFTMPSPSVGGVLIALGLRLLAGSGRLAFLSAAHLEAIVRAQTAISSVRHARFDEECRDPENVRALLGDDSVARLAAVPATPTPENPLGSTTHISVIDGEGAAVSLTMTNGEGSGHVLEGTGVHVNNLLGEEDLHPRGFHADPPGAVLSTMMAPTLALGPGEALLALGSGGSNRLRNAILTTLCHIVEHGRAPGEAVAAPRIHVDAARSPEGRAVLSLAYESAGLPEDGAAYLADLAGYTPVCFAAPSMYFGGVHLAERTSRFSGAGDPRRGGALCIA